MPPAMVGAHTGIADVLTREFAESVLHSLQRTRDPARCIWDDEQSLSPHSLHECWKAELDKLRVQGHVARLLRLHRSRLRGDPEHPDPVGVPSNRLPPQILPPHLRDLSDARPGKGEHPLSFAGGSVIGAVPYG
ncbi:hypothetical protein OFEAOIEE_LOCUS4660 [Methylorubrum extorquens]